ncbi:hypothetical protein SDC9_36754 [bioreactor metagenome]|uniref:Uncharacterized protein n=1 Tax=bioreactor metagenome TaxID=1076179 RepID=A0A644VH46_9ZZZZ
MNDKNLELITDKEEPLLEVLDYSYIIVEMSMFLLGIIYLITIFIHEESYYALPSFAKYAVTILILRGFSKMYLSFVNKSYKIVFYRDYMLRTKTNEIRYLNNISRAYNLLFSTITQKSSSWNTFKIFIYIIIIPFQIFMYYIFIFRWIGTIIFSKKIFINQYSLVIEFKDNKVLNFTYGFLKNDEKKFIKEYFSSYFNINNLEKGYLLLPTKKKKP